LPRSDIHRRLSCPGLALPDNGFDPSGADGFANEPHRMARPDRAKLVFVAHHYHHATGASPVHRLKKAESTQARHRRVELRRRVSAVVLRTASVIQAMASSKL
jgi:hypothetical protein